MAALDELNIDNIITNLQPNLNNLTGLGDQYIREKVGNNVFKRTPIGSVLEQHPAYPALDLNKVGIANIETEGRAGEYDRLKDQILLDPQYTNPNKLTEYDLQKLMHETTHRSMNVDPNVVKALGVSARNIPYTKGNWEYNPKDFGFTGPILKPSDPSEIFTRRVDVDTWDGRIANEGNFMTDIEVADAVKAPNQFHDPILDRKTGVQWQTRGEGAAPGESLRARTGIRSVFDPYVDKYKGAMENYVGGKNYYADYLGARKEGKSTREFLDEVNKSFDGYTNLSLNQEEEGIPGTTNWQKFLSKITRQPYRGAAQGAYGYTPAQLNSMNALGGYYSDPARAQRRLEKRRLNVLNRAAKGKAIGNVNKLLGEYGYSQDAAGNLQFTGGDNTPSVGQQTSGRSDSSWKNDPFAHGGLATMFARRQ